jgi:hypothetical protein
VNRSIRNCATDSSALNGNIIFVILHAIAGDSLPTLWALIEKNLIEAYGALYEVTNALRHNPALNTDDLKAISDLMDRRVDFITPNILPPSIYPGKDASNTR